MAGELRSRNAAFLVKIESTEGVDASPVNTDAILVENVDSPVGTNQIASTEITGTLDAGAPAVLGAPSVWTVTARLRGPSGAVTGSNLPPLDPLLRAAGRVSEFKASIAAASLTAGTSSSATLGTGFSTTAQDYRGGALVLGGATHAGKVASILGYLASKFAALGETYVPDLGVSNTAALPAQVIYKPSSGIIPTVTCYHYQDGTLKKLLGARANFSISMDAAGIPIATITITGSFGGESDTAIPAGIDPNRIAAPLFIQGSLLSSAFLLDQRAVGLSNFSLDFGNSLTSPPDPNTANGFAGGLLTSRDTRVTIDPQKTLVGTQNVIGDLLGGRNFALVARAGSAVGNRLQIVVPSGQLVAAPDGDREGVLTRQMEIKANGADAGAFLCFY